MQFHINQTIVAIRDKPLAFKEDDTFTVKGLRECPCGCGSIQIDIGSTRDPDIGESMCILTQRVYPDLSEKWWHNETYFSPLDEFVNIEELLEVLEEPVYS